MEEIINLNLNQSIIHKILSSLVAFEFHEESSCTCNTQVTGVEGLFSRAFVPVEKHIQIMLIGNKFKNGQRGNADTWKYQTSLTILSWTT